MIKKKYLDKLKKGAKLKLRIDSKTIITVGTKEALLGWINKYPKAQFIE